MRKVETIILIVGVLLFVSIYRGYQTRDLNQQINTFEKDIEKHLTLKSSYIETSEHLPRTQNKVAKMSDQVSLKIEKTTAFIIEVVDELLCDLLFEY